MTHHTLSETCKRQPGIPPSECDGELELIHSEWDDPQALDGISVEHRLSVCVEVYFCGACGNTVVTRATKDSLRLANDWEPK